MSNESLRSIIFGKLHSKVVLLVGLVLLVIFTISYFRGWQQNRAVDQEIGTLKNEIVELEQNNLRLTELIKYLNSTAYIEEKARTDLGLKKAGEQTVVVPDLNISALTAPLEPVEDGSSSNPQRWWRHFFSQR